MSEQQKTRQKAFRVVGIRADGSRAILLGGIIESAANAVRAAILNPAVFTDTVTYREIVVEPDDRPGDAHEP